MKSRLSRVFSFVTALILLITAVPFSFTAQAATFNQIVNAATYIIIYNEGNYSTVVRNDVGALSIGVIGWHATNALNLLKEIVACDPSQALNILGVNLYNEIITSTYWEAKIPTAEEASAISVLISTSHGMKVQDSSAAEYISGYVRHGQQLGITEAEALVFFADYENQNGRTGARNFFYKTKNSYGTVNLATLYNTSSKSNRRTRTYNFCAQVNWSNFSDSIHGTQDGETPVISGVTLTQLSEKGYTVECNVSDNIGVSSVYFAIYRKKDGSDSAKWYQQTPENNKATHSVDISEFSGKAGEYCTLIYAFDEAGNYAYVELNTITVPETSATVPDFTLTVSAENGANKGEDIRWTATASNGSGHYLYKFELYRDGELIADRAPNDFADYECSLTESGVYKVTVTVTDTVSGKSVTADSPDVNIFDPIITDGIICNDEKAQPFQPLIWTVNAHGGEGGLKYSFTLYKDGAAVESTAWLQSAAFNKKLTECGVYYVIATIMDSRSQTVSCQSSEITVAYPVSVKELSFSSGYAVIGKSVTVRADVTNGTGNYMCDFTVFCNGTEIASNQTTDSSEFTFRIPQAGNYTASVKITDADGTVVTFEGGMLTAEETAARGDANCDGKITAADARFALRCAAMLETPEAGLEYAADISNDGRITAADARKILRISANLEN